MSACLDQTFRVAQTRKIGARGRISTKNAALHNL
jgi:hypothetical protein